ncbi:peroxiredoxin-like family protein [Glaciimonas sp. PCH181]|uniref:peroxiredoxin-like family protein n=1 Tax=Glaciimonas sp. PCH181 TaxID=2133943 RepID=UPI000D3B6722|nr:peroxiredoxin-like family protein [Glaciimonas sp. PCH181]PUA19660.1 alkyl hydroperoxide reductase [Glaciimonas sp. PCH181]
MSDTSKESLHKLLTDLHAHRIATYDPKALQINIDQRQLLVNTADVTRYPKVGDVLSSFSLHEVNDGAISLDQLVADGPAVLIFFRFAGCPACNIALPYYQRNLAPELQKLGATLIAVSPQVSDRLIDIKVRHNFDFKVASDIDNALARKLGILYSYSQAARDASIASGKTIGEVVGTGTWELPMPTVLVIDQERAVRFIDVSPDWLVRTEADVILNAVRQIGAHEQPAVAH